MKRLLKALLVGACFACASGVENRPYDEAPLTCDVAESRCACLNKPAAQTYLREMHRRIIDAWAVKSGTQAHDVIARISINDLGEISCRPLHLAQSQMKHLVYR